MQLLWAFNFGKSGIAATDNTVLGIKIDGNNNIYATGFVQFANNIDFDPSSGTANLIPNGPYDAFVAKYSPSGGYNWAFLLGNNSVDVGTDIILDNNNNIYISGYSQSSSMDMDPSSSTATATAQGGGQNIILASYSSNGQYRWGKLIGNSGNDLGRRIGLFGNSLYLTGSFSGTVNFNQGSSPAANMTSIGNTDIFAARYALQDGNIQCNFSVGSTAADEGMGIAIDDTGYVYITGSFSGSGTDFNPGTGSLTATSNGGTDAFLVKYDWGGSNAGYLVGDTICNGEQAYLTYIDTSGATNVTITYNDGTSNYTKSVTSGVPFILNPNPSSTTTYTLVSGGGLCGSSSNPSQVTVQVNPLPVVNAGPDTGVCNTPSLQLSGSSSLPGTYVWSSSQSITNPNSLNPTISGTISGTYRLIATTPAGCSDTDDVVVTALPQPIADAGPDLVICPDDLIQLHGNGGLTYFWYSTIPILSPNSKDPVLHGNKSGIVYLVASNGTTCNDTDEVVITVLPKPTAYAGNDTAVCPNDQIELKGLVTGAGVTHKWVSTAPLSTPDSLNIKVTIDSAKTFYLIAIDSLGCTDTSGIEVSLIPRPDFRVVPGNPSVCFGDSILLQAFGGGTYVWQGGDLSATNDIISVAPSASTTYNVIINGQNCGYADTIDVPVTVNPLPSVTVTKSNDIDCANGSSVLSADGASTYSWYPEKGLNNSYGNQVTATPGENITYTVTGKTDSGCTADAKVDVIVKKLNDYALIVPSAFTPDGNGRNDCYRVKTIVDFVSYKIQINNRWGQPVYQSEDIMDCWDGRYNGKQLDLGTYYYFIKIDTKACGTLLKKGDITLIR
ncbi:MAG: gliding motility-associated C-terminal domain-containing protein [Taibaiella sp.]|nr:gliding motility-associated C-terminal domain-containing protein [Taibaiella sp.]